MRQSKLNKKEYKKIVWDIIKNDLKKVVLNVESKPKTTQDHYGDYLHVLTNLKSQIGLNIAKSLLIKAGGNKNGINSACRIITGN
jgi:hypothetical protein